jgi:hypothetical protein
VKGTVAVAIRLCKVSWVLLTDYQSRIPNTRMCRTVEMRLNLDSGAWDHGGLTLGSVSMHCQASARTSISRGENETPSSLAIVTTSMW